MKHFFSLLILCLAFVCGHAQEVTLYDYNGKPTAYIDTNDADCTIYLWNGTPVGYLISKSGYSDVYGFNGTHLGWYERGLMTNHDGYIVGFKKYAYSKYTQPEPYKSTKKYKSYKSPRNYAPSKQYTRNQLASESLTSFLRRGLR